MKSSFSKKSWKTTISLLALLFLMFALTVVRWPFIGVPMPSSLSSPASPANGSITYDEGANVITVTGYSLRTPCTFKDVWNADKAGTLELVHARAITGADGAPVAVSHALRPKDYYVLGLADVYITVNNFTAESTVQIVGTEEYGAVQTENIAITGNGTYNSTLYWRTIATTQVTVYAGNFTYTLTQGQWGVVWQQEVNQYGFDAKLVVGDGSTATYFVDLDKQITFKNGIATASYQQLIYVRTAANFRLGQKDDASLKRTSHGCCLINLDNTYVVFLIRSDNGVDTLLYSCLFLDAFQAANETWVEAKEIWNCHFTNMVLPYWGNHKGGGTIYNVICSGYYGIRIEIAGWTGTVDTLILNTIRRCLYFHNAGGFTVSNIVGNTPFGQSIMMQTVPTDINLVDAMLNKWTFTWTGTSAGKLYRQYTFNLHVTDKNNNNISGATVGLKDKMGNVVFSVTTATDGTITQQTVSRGYYNQAHGDTLQEYSPHTLTIAKLGYQTYTGNFTLSQKTNWTIALQPLTDGGLIEHVGFVPVDPGLASPNGTYRWLDIADQAYGIGYRNSYNYSQAAVEVAYCTEGSKLQGLLKAVNLKPNFAYQLKLVGTPGTADNERVGLAGRWWQEEWTGTAWANGQNLNDKGDGSSPNPNDQTYLSRRYIQDSSSPTGYHYRYTGYLIFNYFITDSNGTATLQFETGSCYHVVWKTTQRSNATNDGPVKTVTFDPAPSQPAYDTDYPSNKVSVVGEWERLPIGQVDLQPGEYNCKMLLTEESFHGSGGTLAGNWAGAVTANIMFTIN